MNVGWTLAIDLSTQEGSVAFSRQSQAVELMLGGTRDHAERLLPSIQSLQRSLGITMQQIEGVITTHGPGSFTGMRIAFATAKALAFGQKINFHSVSTTEARVRGFQKESSPDFAVEMVTTLSRDRYLIEPSDLSSAATISRIELGEILKNTNRKFLLDPLCAANFSESKNGILFPCRARFLCGMEMGARTLRTYRSEAEWIEASPIYFGTSRFRKINELTDSAVSGEPPTPWRTTRTE